MDPLSVALFLAFGLAVGTYGTLVGLGGGFVIVPAMLLVYRATPQAAVGTSLTVVFLNALSGSISYARQRRIDIRTGLKFALATIPGAALGAYLSSYLTSRPFSFVFGLLLLLLAGLLLWKPDIREAPGSSETSALGRGEVLRRLVDGRGNIFIYSFNERNGILLSFFVGFVSSILGVGGGHHPCPSSDSPLLLPSPHSHGYLSLHLGYLDWSRGCWSLGPGSRPGGSCHLHGDRGSSGSPDRGRPFRALAGGLARAAPLRRPCPGGR
jgi:hypothetical protein